MSVAAPDDVCRKISHAQAASCSVWLKISAERWSCVAALLLSAAATTAVAPLLLSDAGIATVSRSQE